MQPGSNKELQAMSSMIALEDLHNGGTHDPPPIPYPNGGGAAAHDDFFDHMLSTYPASWSAAPEAAKHLFNSLPFDDPAGAYDESAILASRLRLHQISGGAPAPKLLSQQMLPGADSGLAPLPLTIAGSDSAADVDGSFHSHNNLGGDIHGGGYNSFGSSLPPPPQMVNIQNGSNGSPTFNAPASQPPAGGVAAAGNNGGAPRQRVRARRGQATDPHSIAERLRRERIAERMKALQELVPNANKTDKASMLDEIIDYVKFLQLQVKVLSMSRLGAGAAAVAPLVADNSSERERGPGRATGNANHSTPGTDSLTVTEHQVAKLMEEDMGSAMQYLQGKGLCLMPISLASAISSVTRSPNPLLGTGNSGGADAPPSPSISGLTVQSAIANNVGAESSAKDGTSVSKP